MKDDFNFEQTLGLLAQAFENKKYHAAFDQLDELALHPEQKDVISAMSGAIDYLAGKTDPMQLLDFLEEVLETLKNPQSVAERNLQKNIMQKWTETLEHFTSASPVNALQYLTWVNRDIALNNPVAFPALSAWMTLVDSPSVDGYSRQNALRISNEIKSPAFRKAILTIMAGDWPKNPDETLEALNDRMKDATFIQFRESDAESAELFVQIMAEVLQERGSLYDPKKTLDIAWSILVRGEGFNATGVKTTAGIYLDAAQKLEATDPEGAFNGYWGLIGRKDEFLPDEKEEAARRVLDMVAAGKLDNYTHGIDYLIGHVLVEDIFLPAAKGGSPETEALTNLAADVLLPLLSNVILTGDKWSSAGAYNNSVLLIGALPAGDPRAAALIPLVKDGLKRDYKEKDTQAYVSKIGWLLDVAADKGDDTLVRYATAEWKAGVETMAAKNPRQAYEAVQGDIKYADGNSALRALTEAVLPELKARAGIKSTPVAIDPAKFLKRYGGKKSGPAQ